MSGKRTQHTNTYTHTHKRLVNLLQPTEYVLIFPRHFQISKKNVLFVFQDMKHADTRTDGQNEVIRCTVIHLYMYLILMKPKFRHILD
jgi:hypothetical protein